MSPSPQFSIAQIHRYALLMQRRNYPVADILKGSGLTEADLKHPKGIIHSHQYQCIVNNMMAISENPALGMELGMELDYADMGVLGYALMSAPTIRRALYLWLNYSHALYGAFIDCDVRDIGSGFELQPTALVPLGPVYRFCIEELLVFSREVGSNLSGQAVRYSEISLVYPEPGHRKRYTELFDCPITYNASANRIVVESPSLDTPVQSKNAELNSMYLAFCEKMAGSSPHRSRLESQIYNYFIKSPDRLPDIQSLARQLNMAERTLRRRLQERGLSYRTLVRQFRRDLAMEYLLNTHMSTKEIAYQLGFTDSSHFSKTFKSETGLTPNQFRDITQL